MRPTVPDKEDTYAIANKADSGAKTNNTVSAMSNLVELLAELIAIPSVNPGSSTSADPPGGEAEIISFIEDRLVRKGILQGRSAAGIAYRHGRHGGMTIPPFTPTVSSGRMYGRGACDTKASVAAMLAALERIADEGTPEQS